MIRNFLRQSRPWTQNVSPVLGRWNRGGNIDRKVDPSNIANCGDRVNACGDLFNEIKPINNNYENNNYENIDSHNNTLYHPSLKTNYNYSIRMIVDDYNKRWNAQLTVEEYIKNFTRKHRGAC